MAILEEKNNIINILNKTTISYSFLNILLIGIILSIVLLYIYFPKTFFPKMIYSLLLTTLLGALVVTLFKVYNVLNSSKNINFRPIFKLFYIIVSSLIIISSFIGILSYLDLFSSPPKADRLPLLANYLLLLFVIIVSYFIYIYKIKVNDNDINKLPKSLQDLTNNRMKYTILLIFFIIIVIGLYVYNPNKIMSKFSNTTNILLLLLILFIGFVLLGMITSYDFFLNNPSKLTSESNIPSLSSFFKFIYILFAFVLSGLFIYTMLYYLGTFNQDDTKENKWGTLLLNIILLSVMIGILYKLFNVGGYLQRNPIYKLIVNTLLYIPCLFVNISNLIVQQYNITNKNDILFLVLTLLLISSYFIFNNYLIPYTKKKYYKQGGNLLVNNPLKLNKLTKISTYDILNKNTSYDYNCAFSFWFYIDSLPPSTSNAYLKKNNIFSFGNIPIINYDAPSNSLIITVKQDKQIQEDNTIEKDNEILQEINIDNTLYNKWKKVQNEINNITNKIKNQIPYYEIDDQGNRIIYIENNVLLQKWNNIIINYNGGTLDIFYNGKLVKSAIEVTPYIKYDMINIGNENGIYGSLCNLLYFDKPLDVVTINTLYTSLKNSNPPIISNKNESIVEKVNINIK